MPICQLCNSHRAKKSLTIAAITKINNPIRSKKMVPHNTFRTNPSSMTLLAAALFGCWGGQAAAAEFDPDVIKMESMPVAATRTVQRLSGGALSHVPSKIAMATLDELGRKQAMQQSKLSPSPAAQSAEPGAPKPLQIGLGRPVTLFATPAATAAALNWETGPEGRQFAALSVAAAGALGLRLGLVVDALPDSALVHFLTAEHVTVHTHTGAEINETLKHNLASGDTSDEGRTFWSPVIDGEVALAVIELPAGTNTAEVKLSVPMVSHLFSNPAQAASIIEANAISSCHQDATCATAWEEQSASVAKMVFTKSGLSYLCSGTLLANPYQKPYFLSAYHCISSQTVASTLQTYWWYQSATCNGPTSDPLAVSVAGGAQLLYAKEETDTSFMHLSSAPPVTAMYAGWSAEPVARGSKVVGLHHPGGDWKKISRGVLSEYWTCVWTSVVGGGAACQVPFVYTPDTSDMQIGWTSGLTEPGSSGSGLWTVSNDGKRYLIGQLRGGTGPGTTCTAGSSTSTYGRFDLAYKAAIRRWLSPSTVARNDLGGDGRSDLIWRDLNSGKNWAWQMDSAAQPTATLINAFPGSGWTMAGFGDYNGDGKADILWHDTASGSASIYYMNGAAINSRAKLPAVAPSWKIVGSGDINADGLDDLIFHNRETGTVGAWIMNGTASPQWRLLSRIQDASWSVAGVGDFDGDGTADVLWFNAVSGASGVHTFKNGVYSRTIDLPIAAKGWVPAGVGDLNRDYVADIVWREEKTGSIGVRFMNGTNAPIWSGITDMKDLNWEIKRIGDYDGDGKADLFWVNRVNNVSTVYLMDAHIIKGIVNTGVVAAP